MKSFENNLKNRFNNASSLKGIDVDELWDNIEPAISDEPTKKAPIFWKLRFLLLLLFIAVGSITWYQNQEQEIITSSQIESLDSNKLEKKEIKASNHQLSNKHVSNEQINLEQQKNKTEQISSLVHKLPATSTKESTVAFVTNYSTIKSKTISKSSAPYDPKLSSKATKNGVAIKIDKLETHTHDILPTQLDEITNRLSSKLNEQKGTSLPNSKPQPISNTSAEVIESLSLQLLENTNSLPFNGIVKKPDTPKEKTFTLGVFSGAHTIKNNFSTQLDPQQGQADLLNQGHELELGYSLAVEASYRFYKNLFLGTGLEYINSKSEFNIVETWDTLIVNPKSSVGALVEAEAQRTVKHHNKTSYLSVPLLLGFQKSLGKVEIGSSLGVNLNFTTSQSGKSLNYAGKIALYSNKDTILPASQFFLAYHLRPFINFSIKESLTLQITSDIRYQDFKRSAFYDLDHSTILIGMGAGLQYKF